MPNIRPISDLRNYSSAPETVVPGIPVYLTKNGRGYYTIMDMKEQDEQQEKAEKYDRMKAQLTLMRELSQVKQSGEEEGWISEDEVRNHFAHREDAI